MNDATLGAAVRARRHVRGWRLVDLGAAAGVSATQCGLLERGQVGRLTVRTARRIASAVGIDLGWDIGWQEQDVRRLLDADHSAIAARLITRLLSCAWDARAEVSFNDYGDRGRIDVMAFHAPTATLLVVEIKTTLVDAQALLGSLDIKRRVSPRVAAGLGWKPRRAVPAVVLAESTTNRRRLAGLAPLFARFEIRGLAARRWLAAPTGTPNGLLMLAKLPSRAGSDVRRAGRRRVRRSKSDPRSMAHGYAASPAATRA